MLRTERERDVIVWTLDRPEAKNALNSALLEKLAAAIDIAANDGSVRAAVLTGAGGAFASGGDLRELRDKTSESDAVLISDMGEAVCRSIGDLPFPVIAALPGVAFGGGAELAVACDMRIAEDHTRICFKQVRMGTTTTWGTLPRLLALVGPSAATRALLTAQEISAAEARAMGLVDFVTEAGAGAVTALAWCTDISEGGRKAIAETKALLRAASSSFYGSMRSLERDAFVRTWTSPEHAEAIAAYFGHRPPSWHRDRT